MVVSNKDVSLMSCGGVYLDCAHVRKKGLKVNNGGYLCLHHRASGYHSRFLFSLSFLLEFREYFMT